MGLSLSLSLMIFSPSLWAIRLILKDQLLQDLFYIDGFSSSSEKVKLTYAEESSHVVEYPLRCLGERRGLPECSFWFLLQKIVAGKRYPKRLTVNDINLFGESLQLINSETIVGTGNHIVWLQLLSDRQDKWQVRLVIRRNRSSMIQRTLQKVEIYLNNQLYYVIAPENSNEPVSKSIKVTATLVHQPACLHRKETEESNSWLPPPPPPPGAGGLKQERMHPLNIVHYWDFAAGQAVFAGGGLAVSH